MIDIYTDGSCRKDGRGAYGFVAFEDGQEIKRYVQKMSETTNNRMELSAIRDALQWVKNTGKSATIYTDSAWAYNGITDWMPRLWKKNGWMNSKKQLVINVDIWMDVDALLPYVDVKFSKVKGHTGNADGNDLIDKLVQEASNG